MQMWHIYIKEYCADVKKIAAKWMDLENITPSEVTQAPREKCMLIHMSI